jgi:hypothetical protein
MDGTAVPIQLITSSGPAKRSAPIQVNSASGRVVLGGGMAAIAKGVVAVGWRAASTDFIISRPGSATVQMLTLPSRISVNGVEFDVVGKVIFATALKSVKKTSVGVHGLRGEYALTGVGGAVNSLSHSLPLQSGSLLWRLQPQADLGGAGVGVIDHGAPFGSLSGFALGIKLVPPPQKLVPKLQWLASGARSAIGSSNRTVVPLPGRDSMIILPVKVAARCAK